MPGGGGALNWPPVGGGAYGAAVDSSGLELWSPAASASRSRRSLNSRRLSGVNGAVGADVAAAAGSGSVASVGRVSGTGSDPGGGRVGMGEPNCGDGVGEPASASSKCGVDSGGRGASPGIELRSGGRVNPGRVAHSGKSSKPPARSGSGSGAGSGCGAGSGSGAGCGCDAGSGSGAGSGAGAGSAAATSSVQSRPSHRRRRAGSTGSGYHPAGTPAPSPIVTARPP